MAERNGDFIIMEILDTKLRIHRFENEEWGRCHLPWFKSFDAFLNNFFDVEIINYNEDGKTFKGNIELGSYIDGFGHNPPLSDVDCVVENLKTKQFFVLTFGKYFTSYVVHYLKSQNCVGILSSHFSHRFMYDNLKANNLLSKLDKVHPWFFGFYEEFDVDYYRNLRGKDILNKGLFFKGCGWKDDMSYRNVIRHLYEAKIIDPNCIPFEEYLMQLSHQKIGLSYYIDVDKFNSANDYPGEMCYRDIEMTAIGIPFIRIEYKSELQNAFIPNYHYIVIPRESAYLAHERGGHGGVAKLFVEKYNEVKNDNDFLRFITKNQVKWYDSYARWPKPAEYVFNKFNLKDWRQL